MKEGKGHCLVSGWPWVPCVTWDSDVQSKIVVPPGASAATVQAALYPVPCVEMGRDFLLPGLPNLLPSFIQNEGRGWGGVGVLPVWATSETLWERNSGSKSTGSGASVEFPQPHLKLEILPT